MDDQINGSRDLGCGSSGYHTRQWVHSRCNMKNFDEIMLWSDGIRSKVRGLFCPEAFGDASLALVMAAKYRSSSWHTALTSGFAVLLFSSRACCRMTSFICFKFPDLQGYPLTIQDHEPKYGAGRKRKIVYHEYRLMCLAQLGSITMSRDQNHVFMQFTCKQLCYRPGLMLSHLSRSWGLPVLPQLQLKGQNC